MASVLYDDSMEARAQLLVLALVMVDTTDPRFRMPVVKDCRVRHDGKDSLAVFRISSI